MAIRLSNSSEPNIPPNGRHWLYVDETDNNIKIKKYDGTIKFLENGNNSNASNGFFYNKYYTLTEQNILTKKITLPREPSTDEGIIFLPVGGSIQNQGVDFLVSGSFISWDGTGLESILEVDDVVLVSYLSADSQIEFVGENIVLTNTQIYQKKLTLTDTPLDEYGISVYAVGGPLQYQSSDFILNGSTISWDGLGLDGILETLDELAVFYHRRKIE